MRFVLTVVISAALGTVIPPEQWNGGSNNAFQISSAFAQSPAGATLTVNGSSTPITVPGGTTISLSVANAPGSPTDCVTLDFIDFAGFDGIHHQFFTWATNSTMTLSFAMPTAPGVYAVRYWQGCATQLVASPTVTVQSSLIPTLTLNGSSAPITVAAGSTITLSMQNAPGAATDCVTVDFTDFRDWVSSGYQHKFFAWVTGSTMTWSFSMPSGPGPYAARYWQGCATQLAASPTVTVASSPPPPPSTSGCSTGCFYVSPTGDDSNPGTQAAPWRTLHKVAATLSSGQTAVLMDGTYTEGGVAFRQGAGVTQPITVIAQNKWQATLSSTASCSPAIGLYASHIVIQDIRIVPAPGNSCGTPTVNIPAAIRAWEQSVPTVNTPTTGYVGFTARGVYVGAGFALGIKTNEDYSLVENCEIHGSLEAFNDIGTIFRNNVTYGADVFGSTVFAKGGTRNIQIYNNVVHMTGSSWTEGLLLGGSSGAQYDYEPSVGVECYNCVAYNNVVINETGISRDVFVMAGCKDCTFLNNIGINGATSMRGGGGNKYPTTNPTWQNNILTIPTDPGLTADWHLAPGSGYQDAGIAMPTVPAYGGGVIDVSKNKDGVTRTTTSWNLGIY